MRAVRQSIGSFGEPTNMLEHMVMTKEVVIDENPVTRWCFQNVLIKMDENSNRKPIKSSGEAKIDIVIAFIQSIRLYMELQGILSDNDLEAVLLN